MRKPVNVSAYARPIPGRDWDRMSYLARERWLRGHAAWIAQRQLHALTAAQQVDVPPAHGGGRPAAVTIAYLDQVAGRGQHPGIDLAASRLGMRPKSLRALLRAHGRVDLIERLS